MERTDTKGGCENLRALLGAWLLGAEPLVTRWQVFSVFCSLVFPRTLPTCDGYLLVSSAR